MEDLRVKDLMIPIDEYTTVHKDDTLLSMITSLEKSQKNLPENRHPHRAVLVLDDDENIIGKIGHQGFLKALEPKYRYIEDLDKLAHLGVSSEYLNTMKENLSLWEDSFGDVCNKINNIKIKEVMHPVTENIEDTATIFEALHKFIVWQTLSMLVIRDSKIIGILRLSDLYNEIAYYIKNVCSH